MARRRQSNGGEILRGKRGGRGRGRRGRRIMLHLCSRIERDRKRDPLRRNRSNKPLSLSISLSLSLFPSVFFVAHTTPIATANSSIKARQKVAGCKPYEDHACWISHMDHRPIARRCQETDGVDLGTRSKWLKTGIHRVPSCADEGLEKAGGLGKAEEAR